MNLEQFNFHLPKQLIAQKPVEKRESSRMLVVNKDTKKLKHRTFYDFKNYLKPGDCLVLNDTKVIPARLFGIKKDTGARIEILLLHEVENDCWEALVKPAKKVPVNSEIIFGNGLLRAKCIAKGEQGLRTFSLTYEGVFHEVINELGEMPLPPYIQETLQDDERYQTVYAKHAGSAAAPTAGLHFTEQYLKEVKQKGVMITYVTLHVGLGTFRPVNVTNIEEHTMHAEYYYISKQTAETLNQVRENNGRIIAVGTTSTRALETIATKNNGRFQASSGWTDIFIYPPYEFQAIDCLLTNFHLPKSTLLMLVSAFASRELTLKAYQEAIREKYRFFSFGDAMFIYSDKG